jgi:hypothetical protein
MASEWADEADRQARGITHNPASGVELSVPVKGYSHPCLHDRYHDCLA